MLFAIDTFAVVSLYSRPRTIVFAIPRTVLLILIISSCLAHGDEANSLNPASVANGDRPVDFVTQIQPIFKRACWRCHGSDKQKGNYRLDIRETALKGGDSYAPNIIPGKSAESPLIRFVRGTGDLTMPPDGDRLTVREIELLSNWIDGQASWPDAVAGKEHDKQDLWSLKPLVRPDVPEAELKSSTNPIDRFIRKTLLERKLHPAPEADRQTLIRRVYFDLIGLPPDPKDVDDFVGDPATNAYELLVDRLLNSPRYGERWARHWIDTAHFAETHGHDQDRIREHAWPYRDYLITALNSDTPYWRFIQEQVAADVLFPDQPLVTPALGFLAAGPWDESSLRDIREDTFDRQIARYLDRDDMLTNVISNVTSMTVQCARCHDHKFDPISQRDYYALQAVFAGVERANRRYDIDPDLRQRRGQLAARKSDLESRTPAVMTQLASAAIRQQVDEWEQRRLAKRPAWTALETANVSSAEGVTLTTLPDGSVLSSGACPDKDTVTVVSQPISRQSFLSPTEQITAIRLDVLTDDSLPKHGPGRNENGNFHLSEFELWIGDRDRPESLVNPTADFNQSGWEISKTIDQKESTAWGIDPRESQPHHAIFELKTAITLPENASGLESPTAAPRLKIVLKQLHGRSHLIGRFRISLTGANVPVRVETLPESVSAALSIPAAERTEEQFQELARHQQLELTNRQLAELPNPHLVYSAAADFDPDGSMHPPKGPRPIHVLYRGDIRQPRDEMAAGALSCIKSQPAQFVVDSNAPESARRAAFAQWLTHKEHPLTWRSIVNRVWHYHFGRGLVGTLNDFGHMGETPTHPELLDWLAVEFRDGGQSLKSLHRLIVTSQTYRQSVDVSRHNRSATDSTLPDQLPHDDAENRLLSHMNRTRLDAESIRDAILQISGRLDLRMGGPSDRQFDLKPGIHVTPSVDYGKFDPNSDLGRRRSVYRFLFRTLPDPFMETLDCPSGDQITPVRGNSVTVQQSLALWNDVFIARYCEQIASRVEADVAIPPAAAPDQPQLLTSRIDWLVRLILGRRPAEDEAIDFRKYTAEHGLANLCRLLLNSNEFLFVN